MTERVRVLVVDDSAFMRHAISQLLAADGQIEVVGTARDGLQALDLVGQLHPDVVTLDVEMPRLGGLATLERIMDSQPLPVVMLSALTAEGTTTTMEALRLGAVDFVAKPSGTISLNIRQIGDEIAAKVKAAAQARVSRPRTSYPNPGTADRPLSVAGGDGRLKVVIIGSSTGGPKALYELVPALPRTIDAAVLIVQHMPAGFTHSLAERLDEVSALTIREAADGDRLESGVGLVAPGGRHLAVSPLGRVSLSDEPPVHGVRPAVDVTMQALARTRGHLCLGVILTGMGSDGTVGCQQLRAAGGKVIAEDASTCVIYGMPRSVVEAGAADKVVPLPEIAAEIVRTLPEIGRSVRRPAEQADQAEAR